MTKKKKKNASTLHATDAVLILLHTTFRVTLLMGDMLCHKMNGDNNRILSSDCRYSCQTGCPRADQIDLENWWEIDDFKDSSTTEETCITSATTIAQQTILLLTLKLSVSLSPLIHTFTSLVLIICTVSVKV